MSTNLCSRHPFRQADALIACTARRAGTIYTVLKILWKR